MTYEETYMQCESNVYLYRGKVYIEDADNGDTVMVYDLPEAHKKQ